MKEIGGYIELDRYWGVEYYPDGIALNCARNALAYLIKARNIKKIYLPFFLCSSLYDVCQRFSVEVEHYHINAELRPILNKKIDDNAWFVLVNYYGQINADDIDEYKKKFCNIILDNTQAFFQKPMVGVDTIYSCRKFFGVTDGAYLFTETKLNDELETDVSYSRMTFLLGRFEKTANEFYEDFVLNNELFKTEPIKKMSRLTHNLLRALNYKNIAEIRQTNFAYLNRKLALVNKLRLTVPYGAFMYPLYVDNGATIRQVLQKEKIYIPTLWPDVLKICNKNDLEYDMAINILPLPVDQRYGIKEMQYLVDKILSLI